ncbi:hypothetical protein FB451DRAFT_1549768 [Mycena latifolia]|nr:hypothetical protein FB451DRAFT_1549768 [Mycena latifolia]
MFSPFDLPHGILLLVTDQLAAPADFILHRALAEHLKSQSAPISLKSVTSKSTTPSVAATKRAVALSASRAQNYPAARPHCAQNVRLDDKAGFRFVDVLACIESGTREGTGGGQGKTPLRPVLDLVVAELGAGKGTDAENDEGAETDTLVILDDLAALEWLGIASPSDLTRFVNATLLIRQHVLAPEPDDGDVLHALREQCTFHVEVRPLASGRSGAVSGQVALHAGPGLPPGYGGVRLLPRSAALQYRLTDAGAMFFERGTGAGVL